MAHNNLEEVMQDRQSGVCKIKWTDTKLNKDQSLKLVPYNGTGFRWGSGFVVTNAHCAGDTTTLSTAEFIFPNCTVAPSCRLAYIMKIRWSDTPGDEADLALVHCPELDSVPGDQVHQAITVGFLNRLGDDEEECVCMHHAEDNPLQVTNVRLSNRGDPMTMWMAMSPSIPGGSSGAPVYARSTNHDALLGVNYCGDNNMNLYVPVQYVKELANAVVRVHASLCGIHQSHNLYEEDVNDPVSRQTMKERLIKAAEDLYKILPAAILISSPNSGVRMLLRENGVALA